MTTAPDGLFQYGGEPVGGARFTSPWATVYFVDGTDGNATNDGSKPDFAMSTIQRAVTAASAQDVIYVRPLEAESDYSDVSKYAEEITVPVAKTQLSLIGVLNGTSPNYGPKIRQNTASAYCIDVYAPSFHLENMCLQKGGTGEGGLRLRGADTPAYNTEAGSCGATINNVTFRYAKLLIEGGYGSQITNCTFENVDEYAFDLNSSVNPARRHKLTDSYFLANNGAAVTKTYIKITSTTTDFVVNRCWFDIVPSDGHYLEQTSGVLLGMISNCMFLNDDITVGTTAAHITVPVTFKVANLHDDSGTLVPST